MLFRKKNKAQPSVAPDERLRHIAFIMDGNGRWASRRGMPREYGHREGSENFKRIVRYCGDIGVKIVTVYAFSTENRSRPEAEIKSIMQLLDSFIDGAVRELEKNRIQYHFLGDLDFLDPRLAQKARELVRVSAGYPLTLNVALNYGGRAEIVHAVRALIADGVSDITEEAVSSRLYTAHCPDPDLIIRTAGEFRLSNFLLWQAAYSELYVTKVLWPDLSPSDIDRAVEEFYRRERRFGKVL